MKASELRIGNLIELDNEITEIIAISKTTIWHKDGFDSFAFSGSTQGIPLTEEWLLKFGFEKKENDAWFFKLLPKTDMSPDESILRFSNGILLWKQYDKQGMSLDKVSDIIVKNKGSIAFSDTSFILKNNSIIFERHILFVHQLQNIYFALTGKELIPLSNQ